MSRVIAWFSCGVPSAVALHYALYDYGPLAFPAYTITGSEHPDNYRFMRDVEKAFNVRVTKLRSKDYKSIDDVFARAKFLRGARGARCTVEMKKKVRQQFQMDDDVHIFGYTNDRADRERAFRLQRQNPELYCRFPLIERGLKRKDCFSKVIHEFNLNPPITYELGLPNANCLGCVKSESPTYWLRIKEMFPGVFWRRARQERELGFALCRIKKKPLFLDQLTPEMSTGKMDPITCDFLCGGE